MASGLKHQTNFTRFVKRLVSERWCRNLCVRRKCRATRSQSKPLQVLVAASYGRLAALACPSLPKDLQGVADLPVASAAFPVLRRAFPTPRLHLGSLSWLRGRWDPWCYRAMCSPMGLLAVLSGLQVKINMPLFFLPCPVMSYHEMIFERKINFLKLNHHIIVSKCQWIFKDMRANKTKKIFKKIYLKKH